MTNKLATLDKQAALEMVGLTSEQVAATLDVPDDARMKIALWRVWEELRRNHGLIFRWDKGRIVTVKDPEQIARAASRAAAASRRRIARQAEKVTVAANLTKDDGRARQLDRRAECYRRQAAMARLVAKMPADEAAAAVAQVATSAPRGKPTA